jgi:low affinity Fe/Cu permease
MRRIGLLERLARRATVWTGGSLAFALAVATIIVWLVTGPIFGFSDTWQLVINTGTTIVTFLMVFLIQRTQNKESQAVQLKLNELVAAVEGASNRLINVEDLSEHEVEILHKHYRRLAELAKRSGDLRESHSIEEAERRHRSGVPGRSDPMPGAGQSNPVAGSERSEAPAEAPSKQE